MLKHNKTRKVLAKLFRQLLYDEQIWLGVMALFIGIAVAYAAIAFRYLLEILQDQLFGISLNISLNTLNDISVWAIVIVPTIGGLLIGLFLYYFMPNRRSVGVADVIATSSLERSNISLGHALKGAAVNVASIGVGASVGREGPVIHLGAAIAAWFAKQTRLNPSLGPTLLGCGIASAIGASFNAPIAGVFFALEVIIGRYALNTFTPIVISSVAGTVISRIHFGAFPAFIIPEYSIASFFEFPAFILLGIVSALVALAFMKSIFFCEDTIDQINLPIWIRPALGGLFIGVVALFLPEILGVGYVATNAALQASLPIWLLIALVIVKTATTAISLGCRFGGGVFSPAIFVGAMLGGAFGIVAGSVFPDLAASPGFYALVGMGAVAAPVIGAPISTILIVFELTGEVSVVIAAMVTISISCLICYRITGGSFFFLQLQRQGLNILGNRGQQTSHSNKVVDIMSKEFELIPDTKTIAEIRIIFKDSQFNNFFVTDTNGHLVGSIDLSGLKDIILSPSFDLDITARELAKPSPRPINPSDDIEWALDLMETQGQNSLPVVLNDQVIGILHQKNALIAQNRILKKTQISNPAGEKYDSGKN